MRNKTLLLTTAAALLALAGSAQMVKSVETVTTNGLFEPYGIVADDTTTNNYCYITDSANNRVLRFAPVTGDTVDLTGKRVFSPAGIARLPGGKLVVAESGSHRLWLLDPSSLQASVLAGDLNGQPGAAEGTGTAARFNTPSGVAVYWDGTKTNVYIADLGNNVIRKLDPNNLNVTTVAVIAGTYSQFKWPAGVAVDGTGRIYVADTGNHSIKTIETNGRVTLYAGSGSSLLGGSEDAIDPLQARFRFPRGLLWIGGDTGLLVSDTGNHTIRRVGPRGVGTDLLEVTTLAGKPETSGNADGAADTAQFWEPVGLAVDLKGMILVADLKNNAIRSLARDQIKLGNLNPPAGSYKNPVEVTVTNLTSTNAEYYYTLDGKDPTRASSKYTGPVPITQGRPGTNSIELRVRGFSPDFAASDVLAGTYTFFVNPLTNAPAAGTYTNDIKLQIGSETKDVTVRYTTTGATPTETSARWDNAKPDFGQTCTFKAIGFRNGDEPTAELKLDFIFQVGTVSIEPSGTVNTNNDVSVKLKCGTTNAALRWTLSPDGNPDPTDGTDMAHEFTVGTNGILKVMGFKPGYTNSPLASATYNLFVSDPVIHSDHDISKTNAPLKVVITNATVGATIYYRTDGKDPIRTDDDQIDGTAYTYGTGGFYLMHTGTLKVGAFKKGYTDSKVVSQVFDLQVAKPGISPAGATNNNAVEVTLTNLNLPEPQLWWTIDGSEPAPTNGMLATHGVSFPLARNGTLKAKAFFMGFTPSETASADFNLQVATPVADQPAGTYLNQVKIRLTDATTNVTIYYTVDGSTPGPTNSVEVLTSGGDALLDKSITLTNAAKQPMMFQAVGVRDGFKDSQILKRQYAIQVDKPQILQVFGAVSKPAEYGYFPDGAEVDIKVINTNASVYYTLDGSPPTTNSILFTNKFKVDAVTWPKKGLQLLQARAFLTNALDSEAASIPPINISNIGIPQDAEAGIGATIVLPLVVNMKPEEELRSVQCRLLVYPFPLKGVPDLAATPRFIPANESVDFVTLAGPTPPGAEATTFGFSTNWLRAGTNTINILEIYTLGGDANFHIEKGSFGVIGLIAVPIPTNAVQGQTYAIQVDNASGTSDGKQLWVELEPVPVRTIRVTNHFYRVGNTAPGAWYNAGTFGDKAPDSPLNNADFNNAFDASLGVRVPFPFTDAFDAMDTFPLDTADRVGGDGQIRFLDWQQIALQALLPENNPPWWRSWSAGGVRRATGTAPPPLLPAQQLSNSLGLSGKFWPDAVLEANDLGDVEPGQSVSVPVTVSVLGNGSLAGLQFRAIVRPENGAPPLEQAVAFAPAAGLPAPLRVAALPLNQAGQGWSSLLNPFSQQLTGRTPLGAITFTVPATALPGQSYSIQLAGADGAPDLNTQYDFTVNAGSVNVGAPAKPPATPPVRGFKLRWQGQAGSLYVIESTTDLTGNQWTVEADDLEGGNGAQEWLDQSGTKAAKFYRVRVKR